MIFDYVNELFQVLPYNVLWWLTRHNPARDPLTGTFSGYFRTSRDYNMRGPRFGGMHLHQSVVLAGAQMDKMSLLEDALKHLDEPFQLVVVGEVNSGAPLPPNTALGCSISPCSTQLLQPPDIGIRQNAGMALQAWPNMQMPQLFGMSYAPCNVGWGACA